MEQKPELTLDQIRRKVDGFFARDDNDDSEEHYRYLYQAMLQSLKIEEDFWKQFGDKPRFHHKNNTWFMLGPDGSVTIFKVDQTHQYAYGRRGVMDKWKVIWSHTLDRDSWISVIRQMATRR